MQKRDVQAPYLSPGFSDFGWLSRACPRSVWSCGWCGMNDWLWKEKMPLKIFLVFGNF